MTTPFDQQPQPVPPSEGTNDAPEDRANAPTVPNTVPAGQPNVASDGATTTPMTPATASQRPAGAPFDRVYAVSPQQLFQVIHDQLLAPRLPWITKTPRPERFPSTPMMG